HVAQVIPLHQVLFKQPVSGRSHQVLNRRARYKMDFVARQPYSVTKIALLIVTEEIFVEQKTADFLNELPTKHQAGPFAAKYGITPLILRAVRFEISIMIRQSQSCKQ